MAALASCLVAYGWGIPAEFAAGALFQTLLVLGRLRTLLWLALVTSFLPNLALNLLLIGRYGEVGLAGATSIVAVISLVANYVALRALLKLPAPSDVGRKLGSALVAAAAMLATGLATVAFSERIFPATPLARIAVAIVAGIVSLAVYDALASRLPTRTVWNDVKLFAWRIVTRQS